MYKWVRIRAKSGLKGLNGLIRVQERNNAMLGSGSAQAEKTTKDTEKGSGLRLRSGSRFGDQGAGFRIQGLGFKVHGLSWGCPTIDWGTPRLFGSVLVGGGGGL